MIDVAELNKTAQLIQMQEMNAVLKDIEVEVVEIYPNEFITQQNTYTEEVGLIFKKEVQKTRSDMCVKVEFIYNDCRYFVYIPTTDNARTPRNVEVFKSRFIEIIRGVDNV